MALLLCLTAMQTLVVDILLSGIVDGSSPMQTTITSSVLQTPASTTETISSTITTTSLAGQSFTLDYPSKASLLPNPSYYTLFG